MICCNRCGTPVADPRTLQNGRCFPCDRVANLWELVVGVMATVGGAVFIGLLAWAWSATSFAPKGKAGKTPPRSVASTQAYR